MQVRGWRIGVDRSSARRSLASVEDVAGGSNPVSDSGSHGGGGDERCGAHVRVRASAAGYSKRMQRMPYFVMAGLVIASLLFAIVGGGALWIVPVVVIVAVVIYAIWDRRAKQREGRGERLAAR